MLDLVQTNEEDMVYQISYSAGLGSSDHVCILIFSPRAVPKSCIGYNYYTGNFDNLRNLFDEADWDTQLQSLDTYAAWNVIANILENAIEACIP